MATRSGCLFFTATMKRVLALILLTFVLPGMVAACRSGGSPAAAPPATATMAVAGDTPFAPTPVPPAATATLPPTTSLPVEAPTPKPTAVPASPVPSPTATPTPPPRLILYPYRQVDRIGPAGYGKLSGIVYHPLRQSFFAVSDLGRVLEIAPDGSLLHKKQVWGNADFEGITTHPDTGLLYVAVEGKDIILEIHPESLEILATIPIERLYGGNLLLAPEGDGIEGITFVPAGDSGEGTFFLVNQSRELTGPDASIILETAIDRSAGKPVARIRRYFSVGVTDMSGLQYVPSNGSLLITSDANDILLEVSLAGELLGSYPLPGEKQEGITVDEAGLLYIADDSEVELTRIVPAGSGSN